MEMPWSFKSFRIRWWRKEQLGVEATAAAGEVAEAEEHGNGGDVSCKGVAGGSRGANAGDISFRRGGGGRKQLGIKATAAVGEAAGAEEGGNGGDNSCKRGGGGRRSLR